MCPLGRRLVEGRGSLFERGTMCCHCLIVESKAGLLLVDSGLGLGDIREPSRLGGGFVRVTAPTFREEETAIRQVEAMGHSAKDVRHVLLTHLDLDHAGGIGDFPDAEIHLHSREHAAAMKPETLGESHRYRPAHWAHGPSWARHDTSGERWFGFESVRALPGTEDEVLLIPLFGHTRGHSGIAVKGEKGWVLHAGDAYFFRGEMDPVDPYCTPGLRAFQSLVQIDGEARHENQRRLRELSRDHAAEVRVFSAHDPVELERLRAA
jgi:glyoxylase-like metal-dependent hydrolase (beta-lactamase superfamily II)